MSARRVLTPADGLWRPFADDVLPEAVQHLHDLVGMYSEAWLMTGNDTMTIFVMWLAGELATAPAHRLGGWFESQMDEYYGQDYERVLRQAVWEAGCWLDFDYEQRCIVGTPLWQLRQSHPAFDAQMRLAEAGQ
jgi:hypothetical protein